MIVLNHKSEETSLPRIARNIAPFSPILVTFNTFK
ncbi:hypothetical protein FHS60_000672 [Alloprevotella rava]|uniref:Uncharacterized protein n=1 Tax=Alloprevotella rava TaxID=671218 RepID=A0A7W5YDF6_9BACT|nr:hypothetical protein [Alloprevotella rava]